MATSPFEFQPQIHWGLDPVFSSCAKMYIRDILEMPEYPQYQGAYAYKNHPVWKVDIMGVVVKVVEKSSLFHYCVDDATGVIGCCCWKPKEQQEQDGGCRIGNGEQRNTAGIVQELEHLAEESNQEQTREFKLGDFLHVRGRIKTFRGQREISASYYAKIEDPACNAEIVRMCELPKIYHFLYDKPFTLPAPLAWEIDAIREERETGLKTEEKLVKELMEKLQDFMKQRDVKTFQLKDLQTVAELMDIAAMPCREFQSEHAPSTERVPAKQIHTVFKKAVEGMEETGLVFRKDGSEDAVFAVVCETESLEKAVLSILRRDSKKPKFAEKGCHYLHVVDCLHNVEQFRRINVPTVLQVLDKLESQSSIISCTRRHYVAFS